jgi:hypothetical protein
MSDFGSVDAGDLRTAERLLQDALDILDQNRCFLPAAHTAAALDRLQQEIARQVG